MGSKLTRTPFVDMVSFSIMSNKSSPMLEDSHNECSKMHTSIASSIRAGRIGKQPDKMDTLNRTVFVVR